MKKEQPKIVLISLDELEVVIVDCVNACLKSFTKYAPPPPPTAMPKEPDGDALLTKKQAAALLSVSTSTIDNYSRAGILERVLLGRAVRFRRADVLAISQNKKGTA